MFYNFFYYYFFLFYKSTPSLPFLTVIKETRNTEAIKQILKVDSLKVVIKTSELKPITKYMIEDSVCYMGETNFKKKNEQKEAIYRKHNIKLTKRQRLS